MIRACCPDCRLRFSPAATVYLDACPECGQSPTAAASPESVVGFRLIRLADRSDAHDPAALAVRVPMPDPGRGRP